MCSHPSVYHLASSNEVQFHIDSRETSRNQAQRTPIAGSNDRTIGRDLNAPHTSPKERDTRQQKEDLEMSSRPVGTPAVPSGQAMPGYANDAVYGSAHNRAKVEGGYGTGYYDDKEQKFHEDLPRATFGERLLTGVIRPTNLSAGERPKMGLTSTGVDNFDRMTYEKVSELPQSTGSTWWPHFASLPFMWYPYNVNLNAYRLGMIPVLAICLMGTDQRHHRWMYYVTLGLCVDYVCRMMMGPRGSLCTLFGEILDSMFDYCKISSTGKGIFPRSYVTGAPYQFSDLCGACILAAATICFFDGNNDDGDTAGAVLLAFMCLVSFLELVFGFPMFVWMFNQMVHFGWIWKDSEIKAAMMREEYQRMAVAEEMRMATAKAQLAEGHQQKPTHMSFAGNGKRSLPYVYRTANEYHKRHDFNPIKNMKVHYFLSSCAVTGLAWAWAICTDIFNSPKIIWRVLVLAGMVMFSFHFLMYFAKIMAYPRHCMWEWEHPIYRSLFLAIPLNWLLFIPLIIREDLHDLSEVVFWMGAPLLLFMSIVQMAYYFHQAHFWENFNASWMLLPMANAIAAYFLPLVHTSYYEAAWLWLGISIFMWVILSTLIFLKGTMWPRINDAYRYNLWMIMGTAFAIAIAAASIYAPYYHTTTIGGVFGTPVFSTAGWPALAVATFYIGLVLFLVFLFVTLSGYFGRSKFSNHWWIVGVCMVLLSIACLHYHATWRSPTTEGIATTAMVLTNICVALFFLNHLRHLVQLKMFRPDHLQLSPLEFYRLPNKALREALFDLQTHVQNPNATVEEWRHFETVLLPHYVLTSYAFNHLKRMSLYPVMAAWFGPNVFLPIDENAKALDLAISRTNDRLLAAQRMEINSPARAAEETAIRKEFATYVSGMIANMEEEEIHVYGLARRYIGAKEANLMVREGWDSIPPSQWAIILPFVVQYLHSDQLRVRFLETLTTASPEHCQLIGKMMYENLDPFLWDRLTVDIPEMRPRMTRGYTRVW